MRSYYDVLLDRMKTMDLARDGELRASITSHPQVPSKPISPNLGDVAAASLLLGLFMGLGLIRAAELLDDRFRTPDEMHRRLKVPVLASIPELSPTGRQGIDAIQTWADSCKAETHPFRALCNLLTFSTEDTQRLALTSSEHHDGKTTVAANLAVAFAQAGKRTLLIDGDLRRPGLTTLFELTGPRGLSAVLLDHVPIAESAKDNLVSMPQPGLDVIPSGPGPVNPTDLLVDGRYAELLDWAAMNYDQILVDCPPLLAVTDPTMIGRLADGVLLIVNPVKNPRTLVLRAAEILNGAHLKLLGIVANRLPAKTAFKGNEKACQHQHGPAMPSEPSAENDFLEPQTASSEAE
jgi:capsular exopolysaccharide synthesis family protein